MRTWELTLAVDPADPAPKRARIARVIAQDIARGRLKPGERLSSSRTLAETLGVNRKTITAAFATLALEGWVEARSTGGTFVAPRRAWPRPPAPAAPSGPGFALPVVPTRAPPAPRHSRMRLLLGGVPGLRLGYVVAHPDVIRNLVALRGWVDQQGDHLVERAVAQLLEDGTLPAHTRRARRAYLARRDAMVTALRAQVPGITLRVPPGGMAIWARVPGVDTAAWAARALTQDVAFQAGSSCRFSPGQDDHVRLGFAACTEAEAAEAIERMVAVLPYSP